MEIIPQWERRNHGGEAEDRNTTDPRGVRSEGSGVSEQHSGDQDSRAPGQRGAGGRELKVATATGVALDSGVGTPGQCEKQAWDPMGNSEY